VFPELPGCSNISLALADQRTVEIMAFSKMGSPGFLAVFSPVSGTRQIANLADIFLLTPLRVPE